MPGTKPIPGLFCNCGGQHGQPILWTLQGTPGWRAAQELLEALFRSWGFLAPFVSVEWGTLVPEMEGLGRAVREKGWGSDLLFLDIRGLCVKAHIISSALKLEELAVCAVSTWAKALLQRPLGGSCPWS